MARGWKSKSVELEKETAQLRRENWGEKHLTPEMATALRRKETLLLACTYMKQQIQLSQHARHRVMLQDALAELEKRLANLGPREHAAGSY